jgi:predicted nucleic acid-binding protein
LKRFLLDTGIAADYLNRRGGVYARARQHMAEGARLGPCAPVLGELWDDVFSSATSSFNEALLKRHLGHFAIWPFDYVAALEYGRLAAELRRRRAKWTAPKPYATKGVLAKYARTVSSASLGAVTD